MVIFEVSLFSTGNAPTGDIEASVHQDSQPKRKFR